MANPDQVEKIFVGKGADVGDQFLALALANRHALIAGTTTRKTASPQVSTASFSRTGVPVLAAEGKRDLFGIAEASDAKPKFIKRAKDLGFWPCAGEITGPVLRFVRRAGRSGSCDDLRNGPARSRVKRYSGTVIVRARRLLF